jgi:hypothetical protein
VFLQHRPGLPLTPPSEDHRRLDYPTVEPGVYLWRSPLGYQYLRDATGTLDVTPDPQRARLARKFTAHFSYPDTEP